MKSNNKSHLTKSFLALAFILFSIGLKAQYPDYKTSYYYSMFLEGTVPGGGSVSVSISNNIFTLSFSAGFSPALLKQGQVVEIGSSSSPYTTALPNTEIMIPSDSFFFGKGYRFFIVNNKICIYSLAPQTLQSFSGTLSVDLNQPNTVSNDLLTYFTGNTTSTQYPDYTISYNYSNFLEGIVSGGGGVSANISNNIFTLSFNAGFSPALLKQGQVVEIGSSSNPYTTTLPNTEIIVPSDSFFYGKGYRFFIVNNKICIYSPAPQTLQSFSGTLSVNLNQPNTVPNNLLAYFTIAKSSYNRIISTEYLTELGQAGGKKTTIVYYDGLGNEFEQVAVGSTPSGKDIIIPFEYDTYGRKSKDYLPIPTSQNNGSLVDLNAAKSISLNFYGEPPYAEKKFEDSPLNRTLLQGAPGDSWQIGSGHEIKFEYDINKTTDYVKNFKVTTTLSEGTYQPSLFILGTYPESQLFKHIVKEEDWSSSDGLNKTTEEYTDKEGRTLLVRKYLDSTPIDTYYVYDLYGNLSYVIPPLASINTSISQDILDKLCYQYKYDTRNRLVEKKLPGKAWEFMVYDQQDRLVLTQDGNLRTDNNNFKTKGWLFNKYDQFGRIVYTGFFANTASRVQMQTALNSMSLNAGNNETRSSTSFTQNGIEVYYTNNAIPNGSMTVLSVNYYDEYPIGSPGMPSIILGQTVITSGIQSQVNTKSLPTASYIKNIDNDQWTKNYSYYDNKGRTIGTYSQNFLGGYTKTEQLLNFTGTVLATNTYHKRQISDTEIVVKETFEYDHQQRLLKHWHQVNNFVNELLTNNKYNELGQLETKKVGGTTENPIQNIDYSYNIRGWLTGINKNNIDNLGDKLFAYQIDYNTTNSKFPNGKKMYNGNIAQVTWVTSNDGLIKNYTYEYDPLNRLLKGNYDMYGSASTSGKDFYNEYISYDLNSNINTLKRFSKPPVDGNSAQLIDDLVYKYSGNQLTKIIDNSFNSSGYPLGTPTNTISYDENGNMINLLDKNITSIKYNYLNLPEEIKFNKTIYGVGSPKVFGEILKYVYTARGEKLTEIYTHYDTTYGYRDITIDYFDIFRYTSGGDIKFPSVKLTSLLTKEGYISNGQPIYESGISLKNISYKFYYKDYLGNIRVTFTKDWLGKAFYLLENNYYPFGFLHEGYNSNYETSNDKYKYNGKELQETGMYDYGARFYMPDIGRWGVTDPLAEMYPSFSPYVYTLNNPVKYIDPDGRWVPGAGLWSNLTKSDARIRAEQYASSISDYNPTVYKNDNLWSVRGERTSYDEYTKFGKTASFDKKGKIFEKSWSFSTGKIESLGSNYPGNPNAPTISSPSDSYFSHPNTHLAMGALQAAEIMTVDYAVAKVIGYGFKGYYALKQSNLTGESFSTHPRLNSQLDIGHRATTFVTDEILQTGEVGVKDFNSVFFDKHSVYFNKNIGGKDFSIGINPYKKTIFHQAPGVFK